MVDVTSNDDAAAMASIVVSEAFRAVDVACVCDAVPACAAVVPAGCGRVAGREVERRSYPAAPTSTRWWCDRPPLTACTAFADSRATDRADRSRRQESLRSTSGHGARRPARTAAASRHDRGANLVRPQPGSAAGRHRLQA